jgi:hypothetical protein
MKYCYHQYDKDIAYMPYDDPPASWLNGIVTNIPELDVSCGKWSDKIFSKTGEGKEEEILEPVDKEKILAGISKLFRMKSNLATDDDIRWWQDLLRSTDKDVLRAAHFGDFWDYQLPDPDFVNSNCSYRAYDPRELMDVEAEGAPTHDLLTFTNLSRSERNRLRRLAEDADKSMEILSCNEGDYVFFEVDEWFQELGRQQQGMDEKTTALPFALGKVVRKPANAEDVLRRRNVDNTEAASNSGDISSGEDVDDEDYVFLEVYYAADGDPNKTWIRWTHQGAGNKPWVLSVPRFKIYLVNPDFTAKRTFGRRTLSAKGKQGLANVAKFPWAYIPNKGLVPFEDALADAKRKKDNVINKNSKKGHRAFSKASFSEAQLLRVQKTKKRALVLSEKEREQGQSAKERLTEAAKRTKTSHSVPEISQTAAI